LGVEGNVEICWIIGEAEKEGKRKGIWYQELYLAWSGGESVAATRDARRWEQRTTVGYHLCS
jgi:hypothetical protein